MNIDVYAICYNESALLPFFMRHYKKFARKITIFDNRSTDDSARIARRLGADVLIFGNKYLDDREYLKVKNHCYKRSDADYVVVCDMDEFLYHPNLINHLTLLKSKGETLPSVKGYNIYSEQFPKENILEINTGFEDINFAKQIIFSPKVDIKFQFGCHRNNAVGVKGGQVYMMHYRCIGGVGEMIARHRMYAARMCEFNKKNKYGGHYFRTPEQLKIEWANNMAKSKPLGFIQ